MMVKIINFIMVKIMPNTIVKIRIMVANKKKNAFG